MKILSNTFPGFHKLSFRNFMRFFFLTLVGLISIYPIYWLITVALKTRRAFSQDKFGFPHQLYFGNLTEVLLDPKLLTFYINSAIITISTIVLIMVVGTLSGYALARFEFKGRNVILVLFTLTMLVPLTVLVIPLYISLNNLSLLGDRVYYGLIGSFVALNLGIACLFTRGFFRTISKELLDAAKLDGCGEIQTFWYIALPLARQGLVVLMVLLFMNIWNEFFLSMIMITDRAKYTLTLGLMFYQGQYVTHYPQLATAIILATIPSILVLGFFQEKFIKGVGAGFSA